MTRLAAVLILVATVVMGQIPEATTSSSPTGGGVFSEIASQAEAEAGVDNTKGMTSLRSRQSVEALQLFRAVGVGLACVSGTCGLNDSVAMQYGESPGPPGGTPTGNHIIRFDTTNGEVYFPLLGVWVPLAKKVHAHAAADVNSGDKAGSEAKLVTAAAAGTAGNCAQWTATGLGDAGAACGSGGGGAITVDTVGAGTFLFGAPPLGVTAGTMSTTVTYAPFILPYNLVFSQISIRGNGGAAVGDAMAFAVYDAACNKVSGTDINILDHSFGGWRNGNTAGNVTLSGGQLYFLGYAATAGAVTYYRASEYFGYHWNGSLSTPVAFTGSNAGSGSGGAFALPASCGTRTAVGDLRPPIAHIHKRQ